LFLFFFFGPGTFYAKDLFLQKDLFCNNPMTILANLSPGTFLRGRLLIKKSPSFGLDQSYIIPTYFGEPWSLQSTENLKKRSVNYPWLSLGFPTSSVKRVGFRVESRGPLNPLNEILIFEIVTDGSISPRQALFQASILLVDKFSSIAHVALPLQNKFNILSETKAHGEFFGARFPHVLEPLGLDLRNLNLSKQRYSHFRYRGFETVGQVLERVVLESYIIPIRVKNQRCQALSRLRLIDQIYHLLL
jgi:hypothetical protein